MQTHGPEWTLDPKKCARSIIHCRLLTDVIILTLDHRRYSFKDKVDKSDEADDPVVMESIRMFKDIIAGNPQPPPPVVEAPSSSRYPDGSVASASDPLASQIATISANIAAAIVQIHNQDENDEEEDEDEEDGEEDSENGNDEGETGTPDGVQLPVRALQVSGVRHERLPAQHQHQQQHYMSIPSTAPFPTFAQHPEYTIFQDLYPRNSITDNRIESAEGSSAPLRERKRKSSTEVDRSAKRKK